MCFSVSLMLCFVFFKQKTAYEMRISDWSSDVCSSDLAERAAGFQRLVERIEGLLFETAADPVVDITKRQHDIGAAGRCDVGTLWRREFADRDFAETRRIGLELGIVSSDAFLRIFARGRQARGRNGRDVVTGAMQLRREAVGVTGQSRPDLDARHVRPAGEEFPPRPKK